MKAQNFIALFANSQSHEATSERNDSAMDAGIVLLGTDRAEWES